MTSLAARFTLILDRLGAAVAAFMVRQARGPLVVALGTGLFVEQVAPSPHRVIPGETWLLLVRRAERLAGRFRILVGRWQSGTLPPPRPGGGARAGQGAGQGAVPAPRRQALRLPRERGWINKRLAETGQCAAHLHLLLQDGEMARFLAQVPRAGRLLRPLCHALAVDLPAALALPARPRQPRRRPPVPAVREGTPDRPLPAYVLTAGRAWKKRGD